LDRIDNAKAIKSIASSFGRPLVKPNNEGVSRSIDNIVDRTMKEPKYKDAISTLETELGDFEPVQDLLKKVYQECPVLKLKISKN
jgi:hypothetical protein